MNAKPITKYEPPIIPCWLWYPLNATPPSGWFRWTVSGRTAEATYWHPDQPEPPTEIPPSRLDAPWSDPEDVGHLPSTEIPGQAASFWPDSFPEPHAESHNVSDTNMPPPKAPAGLREAVERAVECFMSPSSYLNGYSQQEAVEEILQAVAPFVGEGKDTARWQWAKTHVAAFYQIVGRDTDGDITQYKGQSLTDSLVDDAIAGGGKKENKLP